MDAAVNFYIEHLQMAAMMNSREVVQSRKSSQMSSLFSTRQAPCT